MSTEHKHQWGPWLKSMFATVPIYKRLRLCINGWCPMGQYRNGIIFMARPRRISNSPPRAGAR